MSYVVFVSLILNLIQAAVYFLKIPALNLLVYVGMNTLLAAAMYESEKKIALLYTLVLTATMMLSEFFVVTIMHQFLKVDVTMLLDEKNLIIYSVLCKSMHLMIVLAAKKWVLHRRTGHTYDNTYYLFIFFPISTMILLSALYFTVDHLGEAESIILMLAVMPLIISEFVCYVVYDHIIDKNRRIFLLNESIYKRELQLKQYELYKQKYESSRIILHDIKKHWGIIKSLYSDPEKAEKYIADHLKSAADKFMYTNNEVLNVILNEKADECRKNGIRFSVSVSTNKVNKVSDSDLVAIFCNLLDNAIESSMTCSSKFIVLDVYEVNAAFLAINMTNSCEHELKIKKNRLLTTKSDTENHGFGMASIGKCIEKYRGDMDYIYDAGKKTFSVTILMNFEDNV